MQNLNNTSKIFLFLFSFSLAVWLGSYISRNLLVFSFFEADTLELKEFFKNNEISSAAKILYPVILTHIIAFPVMFISFALLLLSPTMEINRQGWLLGSTIIIFVTAPFEIYLSTKDFNILSIISGVTFSPETVVNLLKDRMTFLGGFTLIEIFLYVGVIYFFTVKPLQKNED